MTERRAGFADLCTIDSSECTLVMESIVVSFVSLQSEEEEEEEKG